MKICQNCGNRIEDNLENCPYCGCIVKKEENKSSNEKSKNYFGSIFKNSIYNNPGMSTNNKLLFLLVSIISSSLGILGVIFLMVWGIKESNFHNDYDLSELSEAGINFLRQQTGNSNNVTMIIIGAVFLIIGILCSFSVVQIQKSLLNKTEENKNERK